jgi:predicted DNA-binding transcriptional regulator AlpA
MTLDDVSQRFGKSKRTILRWVEQGRFPHPVIRRGKLIAWSNASIARWSKRLRQKGDGNAKDRRKPRPARKGVAIAPRDAAQKRAQRG